MCEESFISRTAIWSIHFIRLARPFSCFSRLVRYKLHDFCDVTYFGTFLWHISFLLKCSCSVCACLTIDPWVLHLLNEYVEKDTWGLKHFAAESFWVIHQSVVECLNNQLVGTLWHNWYIWYLYAAWFIRNVRKDLVWYRNSFYRFDLSGNLNYISGICHVL